MKYRILTILIALLLVTACGGGDEPAAGEATATLVAEAPATEEPIAAPADTEQPVVAPTVTLAVRTTGTEELAEAPAETSEATEEPAPSPTNPPASAPTQEPTATTPPQPTQAPAATAAPQTSGTAGFRDNLAVADQFTIDLSSAPAPPAGQAYQGWLVGDDGTTTSIGVLNLNPDGSLNHQWNSPDSENLLGRYARLQITLEPAAGSTSPTGQVVASGGLEGEALAAARRLFVRNNGQPATPLETAYALGLKAQSDVALQHVQNATNAAAIGALVEMQLHLEHVINILEGQAGPRYGDYTGDGRAENPGDGFGVIGYSNQIAQLAGSHQPVATNAAEVQAQSSAIQDLAEEISGMQDIGAASARLGELKAMADQLKAGPIAGLYIAAQDASRFKVSASP